MVGYIVRHRQLGIGKVAGFQNHALIIRFVGGQTHAFNPAELRGGSLSRTPLALGAPCRCLQGEGTVRRIASRPQPGTANEHDPYRYEIALPGDVVSEASEETIIPLADAAAVDPRFRLASADVQHYSLFQAREGLAGAYARMLNEGASLKALLGSRVDLRPHQAFVAGTVLLDHQRRYVMADEVGLGKTIEAGVVVTDLLAHKPDARILVVCPGALTNQWLSELYAKFGGRLFTLLDLHEPLFIPWPKLRQVIVSTTLAAFRFPEKLCSIAWDLVVVDETHHLLASQVAYDFVARLSRRAPSMLLLSALPAHQREEDLLRLLALLEPDRFAEMSEEQRRSFHALHAAQSQLGRGLRIIARRVDDFAIGEATAGDVLEVAHRLLSMPGIADDDELRTRLETIDPIGDGFISGVREFAHALANRYCLSRRVLRNRRRRLVEQEQIVSIARRVRLVPLRPEQIELEARDAVDGLLVSARQSGLSPELARALARTLWQSAVEPSILFGLLEGLERAPTQDIDAVGRDLVAQGHTVGYTDWDLYRELLFRAVRRTIAPARLAAAKRATRAWCEFPGTPHRRAALLDLIDSMLAANPRSKVLIFAGFPGVAAVLSEALRARFGAEAVCEFRADMPEEAKERSVVRFRDAPSAHVLVSDETGGEGRNFQFAGEIVHYDTPWHAAKVEQRIGRLDRIGRERYSREVCSSVLYNAASTEAGLIDCLSDGLRVYQESISGLEFALRDIENALVDRALEGGLDALHGFAEEVRVMAERERAQDDSQSVLDESSFEQGAAARFRRIVPSDPADRGIEGPFLSYFKALCGGNGVKPVQEPGVPAGSVWRLRPEEARFGALPGDSTGRVPLVGDHEGTFRRDVGQLYPRLQFFNVGNAVFDSVIRSLTLHATGRTYALECKESGMEPWVGFEFVLAATPNYRVLGSDVALTSAVERLFPVLPPFRTFVSPDGELAVDPEALLRVRRRVDPANGGRTWWDLKNHRDSLSRALGARDWQDAVLFASERAVTAARSHFSAILADRLETDLARIESISSQDAAAGDTDCVIDLEMMRRAIVEWDVRVDAAGFLSVNGEVAKPGPGVQ